MIPPMAVLPILFIVFGLGDLSKVVLIVFGIAPFMVRDLALAVDGLPREQMVKAQTLGASTWQIAIRVVAAADHAAADRGAAPVARAGLPLPDLGGGDRRRCRPRLPHLPGPPLSRRWT